MTSNVTIKVKGFDEIAEALPRSMNKLGNMMVTAVVDQIVTKQEDIYGNKFAPLSEKYARWKTAHKKDKFLINSGKLVGAVKYEIDGTHLKLVVDQDYAEYVNNGTSKMKARTFIPTDEAGFEKSLVLQKTINDFVESVFNSINQ